MRTIALCLCVVGYTFAGICHGFGLFLLSKVNSLPMNQKYLLINLSAIEMAQSWLYSVYLIFALINGKCFHCAYWHLFMGLFVICMRLVVLHIIIDRFWEIKYPLYIQIKQLLIMLSCGWVFSLLMVMGLRGINYIGMEGFNYSKGLGGRLFTAALTVLDLIVVISAIATYAYFYSRIKKVHQVHHLDDASRIENTARQRNIAIKKFKVPFLVTSTFILFNVSSTLLMLVHIWYKTGSLYLFSLILSIAGILTDAVIYVYFQKDIWITLLSVLGKGN